MSNKELSYNDFANEVKKYLREYENFKNLSDKDMLNLDSFEEFIKSDYKSFIEDVKAGKDFDRELEYKAKLSAYNLFMLN